RSSLFSSRSLHTRSKRDWSSDVCSSDLLLFCHALRLSVVVAVCYGIMQLLHPEQGYWILLTSVFVCRPNYGATRARLVERITGRLEERRGGEEGRRRRASGEMRNTREVL